MARKRRRKNSNPRLLDRVPSPIKKFLWGALYGGVVKEPIDRLTRVVSQSTGFNIADNLGRIGSLALAKQFVGRRMPVLNQIIDAGLSVEGAESAKGGFNLLGGLFKGNMTAAANSGSSHNSNNEQYNGMKVIG